MRKLFRNFSYKHIILPVYGRYHGYWEDTVSCCLILLKTGVCRYTSQTYQAKSLIPKLCQSNPLGDKSSLTRNNASVFPIEYFRWQWIDNNDVYYWISWLICSIHQSGEESVIMHLLCAIVQRVGLGPPPRDHWLHWTGDWWLVRICSLEQFMEAPQRGYWLRLRGASVDVDTSVWRRRKWARLRWRHDPWGDAATTPAAGEVSYRASNEGPHEG